MTPQVTVGGVPLSAIGGWGGLTVTHQWPRGAWEATWSMSLGADERPPALVERALVEVTVGGVPILPGYLSEMDWDNGTFTASGAAREGEESVCLNADGTDTTTVLDQAIDNAHARGALTWKRLGSLSAVPFASTDQTADINYITALADAVTSAAGNRWAVNPDRQAYVANDPTEPDWYVAYGTGVLGVADDALVGSLIGRWYDSTGTMRVTTAGSGLPEAAVDLTTLGAITQAQASSTLAAILAQSQTRLGITNSVTATRSQITSPTGTHPQLWQVRAGHMARLVGLIDPRTWTPWTDIVLGQTVWDVDAATIQLSPVDLLARDLSSIIASLGAQLAS